jgi:2-polyprenyl-6-methoxyphenol hydroxylase-like FAD-dependent oxidoreductase
MGHLISIVRDRSVSHITRTSDLVDDHRVPAAFDARRRRVGATPSTVSQEQRLPSSNENPVAIVGGGIAGLAAARALTKRGISCVVLERRTTPSDGGLAINLPGNAVRALARLGLGEDIRSAGHPLHRREYRTEKDRLLFGIDEDAFWPEQMRPCAMRRSKLIELLATGVPDDCIRRGVGLEQLFLQDDGADLKLVDGSHLRASIVIGADGVRSGVRGALFGTRAGQDHALIAQASWRFMAPDPGIDCWTVWAGPAGLILLMPVGNGEVYGWAAASHSRADDVSHAALIALTARFPDRVRAAVAGASIHHSPLEEVRLDRWSKGRAVLIGDAAHATAPVWAQGAALAMEDAVVLADVLDAVRDPAVALSAYEVRRRERVEHVQKMTDAMSRAARLPSFLRTALLPSLGPKRYAQTYGPLRDDA